MLYLQIAVLGVLLAILGLVLRNLRDYRRGSEFIGDAAGHVPLISVLIPARNEADNIERCLAGILQQDYPHYEILVLDDHSTDDTALRVTRLLECHPRLRLISGAALPEGWAGKTHACWQLAHAAGGDWLLFLDADTRDHSPLLLQNALAAAVKSGGDLVSTFPQQQIGSWGEALTVPMIYWLLFTMLPIGRISRDPNPWLCAACGQFLFTRRDAYFQVGGHAAAPLSLHDGLHLARQFKRCGKRVVLTDLSHLIQCRMYHGWGECWRGFTRNAFQGIGSLPILLLITASLGVLCLAPYLYIALALLSGWPVWGNVAFLQVLVLVTIGLALRQRFHFPVLTVLLLPVALAALIAIQWRSWWAAFRGVQSDWKGRATLMASADSEQFKRNRAKRFSD